jgi:rod shape-determining protein MreC
LFFVLSGVALFALSSANPATMQQVRILATDTVAPLIGAVNRPLQVASEYIAAVSGIAQMKTEIEALREENARLREWHNVALMLKAENERLTEINRLKVPPPHGYITARVISDAGNSYAQSLLVLAGSDDGVVKGQAVLAGDGLVGRIVEGGEKAARILLLTDINSRVPIEIEGTKTRAILAGQNHNFPRLDHLPNDHGIETGQRVVTSGHGGLFLPGLPVGRTYVDAQGQVFVQLFAKTEQLTYVRMIDRVLDEAILQGQIKPAAKTR